MQKYYTGVGSRETPQDILLLMYQLAYKLRNEDWILRSGAADGADTAFEEGAYTAVCHGAGVWMEGSVEIYLPWKGFNGSDSGLHISSPAAFELAASIHPVWNKLPQGIKKLHARNCHQVLGKDLQTPSSFLVCWTKDGLPTGGTRTAIVLAERGGIPVYNLGDLKYEQTLRMLLLQPNLGTLLAGPRGLQ